MISIGVYITSSDPAAADNLRNYLHAMLAAHESFTPPEGVDYDVRIETIDVEEAP